MTVKECYAAMGGNYEEVLGRLRDDARIEKFLKKVVDDQSYNLLIDSFAQNNAAEAFRASHTIKGICLNLCITALYESANELTEALRGQTDIGEQAKTLLEAVKADYLNTVNCIKQL